MVYETEQGAKIGVFFQTIEDDILAFFAHFIVPSTYLPERFSFFLPLFSFLDPFIVRRCFVLAILIKASGKLKELNFIYLFIYLIIKRCLVPLSKFIFICYSYSILFKYLGLRSINIFSIWRIFAFFGERSKFISSSGHHQ